MEGSRSSMSTSAADLAYALHQHARRGGKTARRRQVARVRQMLDEVGKAPHQISRRDVYDWIERVQSPPTRRDRYYAARLFWRLTYSAELPPPRCLTG